MLRINTGALLLLSALFFSSNADVFAGEPPSSTGQCRAECSSSKKFRRDGLRARRIGAIKSKQWSSDDESDYHKLIRQIGKEATQCRADCKTPNTKAVECRDICEPFRTPHDRLTNDLKNVEALSWDDRQDVAKLRSQIEEAYVKCKKDCIKRPPAQSGSNQACPNGQVATNDPFRPYACRPQDSAASCPDGQVATNDPFRPYACRTRASESASASGTITCGVGYQAVPTNNPFQPYTCKASAQNSAEGLRKRR